MERGLTLLMATAVVGALAMPVLFLSSLFFFGVTFAVYLFVWWLGGITVVALTTGFLLRRGGPNDAYESQKKARPVAYEEVS
jgi:hypothetical protein